MTEKEVHDMKYDLLHDLGQALRDTQARVTHHSGPDGAACAAIPGGAAQTRPAHRYGEMLHPDDIAIPGNW